MGSPVTSHAPHGTTDHSCFRVYTERIALRKSHRHRQKVSYTTQLLYPTAPGDPIPQRRCPRLCCSRVPSRASWRPRTDSCNVQMCVPWSSTLFDVALSLAALEAHGHTISLRVQAQAQVPVKVQAQAQVPVKVQVQVPVPVQAHVVSTRPRTCGVHRPSPRDNMMLQSNVHVYFAYAPVIPVSREEIQVLA
jgi:hypothetical protein